jgi:hypothetical protein
MSDEALRNAKQIILVSSAKDFLKAIEQNTEVGDVIIWDDEILYMCD